MRLPLVRVVRSVETVWIPDNIIISLSLSSSSCGDPWTQDMNEAVSTCQHDSLTCIYKLCQNLLRTLSLFLLFQVIGFGPERVVNQFYVITSCDVLLTLISLWAYPLLWTNWRLSSTIRPTCHHHHYYHHHHHYHYHHHHHHPQHGVDGPGVLSSSEELVQVSPESVDDHESQFDTLVGEGTAGLEEVIIIIISLSLSL